MPKYQDKVSGPITKELTSTEVPLLRFFRLFCLLSMIMTTVSFHAKANLDAVELQLIPSDARANCSHSLYRSSDPKSKAIFVTPFAVAGRTPYDGDKSEVHITPTKQEGKFILSIGIYFPLNPEDAMTSYRARDAQAPSCNFESVLHYYNEEKKDKNEELDHIAHLPLTSIDIEIPINDGASVKKIPTYTIGKPQVKSQSESASILEYYDKSYTTEFLIDEDQMRYINDRLVRDEGLQINVFYNFQARAKDGAVIYKVNKENLIKSLQVAAQGKFYLAKLGLEGTLQKAVLNSQSHLKVQAGESEAFKNISKQIVDQIISGLKFENDNSVGRPKSIQGDTKARVSVKGLIQRIKTEINEEFVADIFTRPQATSISSSTRVKHSRIDPYQEKIHIMQGFGSEELSQPVMAGEMFKISPDLNWIVRRQWKEKKSYLGRSQLEDLGVYDYFPIMNSKLMEIENKDINGRFMAEGYWHSAYFFPMPWSDYFRWRRTQYFPINARRAILRDYNIKSAEELSKLRVRVAFSNLGRSKQYFLEELVGDHEHWIGSFENGNIVITAKTDLGKPIFSKDFYSDYSKLSDIWGNPRYSQIDADNLNCRGKSPVPPDCYVYQFRAWVRNLDEVVQERYYGVLSDWWEGTSGHPSKREEEKRKEDGKDKQDYTKKYRDDSSAYVIKGRIDGYALEMYMIERLNVTLPSPVEDQPSNEEVQNKIRQDQQYDYNQDDIEQSLD